MISLYDPRACRAPRLAASALLAIFLWLPTAQSQTLNVTLLGTGDPIPRLDRFGPATLVEAGEHPRSRRR